MSTRVSIVTGANKGIGLAIVRGICKQLNGDVYLTSRDSERGLTAVKQLEEEGLKVKFHQLDVTSRDSISTLKEHVKKTYNGKDILSMDTESMETIRYLHSFIDRTVINNSLALLSTHSHMHLKLPVRISLNPE